MEVELVALAGLTVELTDYWKHAQAEVLRRILVVTLLKKKRLKQSQFKLDPLGLSQTQVEASRPTGQIYLVCMY